MKKALAGLSVSRSPYCFSSFSVASQSDSAPQPIGLPSVAGEARFGRSATSWFFCEFEIEALLRLHQRGDRRIRIGLRRRP